ncbi:hypothetical protein ACFYOT_12295 [Saccharothrix saharensis]|uniref:hypothetical protein n=1 Tax=Saccharothrix saharensis TaxID=571190 RepID=UPI0036C58E9E
MNGPTGTGQELLQQGLDHLADMLGPNIRLVPRPDVAQFGGVDAVVDLLTSDGGAPAQLAVEAKTKLTPRQVEDHLLPRAMLIEQVFGTNLLVLAPWLARRTRELLREHGIGYLDLTGNVDLRVSRPTIVIHTEGAAREPRSGGMPSDGGPTLAGPRAGRLVRALVDHLPPYRATQLSEATGLSLPWVSKLLAQLNDQLLIRRDGRVVVHVDWADLLRARAEAYRLLRHNPYVSFLAPTGIRRVLDDMASGLPRSSGEEPEVIVTGHYAASAVAPLASGGQLMLYVRAGLDTVDGVADRLGLLRVDTDADVLVMQAHDEVVFTGWREVGGVPHVALSQLVVDCLAGPGRLPAEGEAVLRYMTEHEHEWRDAELSRDEFR